MTNEPGRHRLLAILAADAVGFSRLMSLDDRQTVASLDAARAVFRTHIAAGRGSVIDMPGDFILAAFDTAIGAVEAALATQRDLATMAAPMPADRQMHFRIGVHLGDVIESADGSVYGDGVNIAARLQTLAEPGGIVISQAVQGVVHGRVEAPLADIGEHAVKNIARPVRAYRVGGAPDAATNAPTAAAAPTPPPLHNLPRSRTHFIGRAKQRADCAAWLQSSAMLTLTGIGGSGKTRLALQVAQDVLGDYADGVWFVDLAPLQDAQQVAAATAAARGLRVAPGESPLAMLQRDLAARRCLLILDNCEHVLDAVVAMVEALLAACPGVAIMATSREALGVSGEQVAAVRSMAVPDGSELEALQHCDAVQLFVDRARLVAPDFHLDAGNAAAIADICRRLDGIPLALELAAARVKMLTLEQIRSRLDDRFKLLTGGNRALPRHQTLQAVIQWSYDQLAPEEQRLLRQLSVFAGGWTLAAATALVGPDADEYDVLEVLTRLADKSLVTPSSDGDEARYSMLETVRQYAQDRLDESGEGAAARERHLDYFVALAEAPPAEDGSALDQAMRRLDRDRENLVAGYRWSGLAPTPEERGLRLVRALLGYWRYVGQIPLAHRLAQEAIDHPNAQAPTLHRLRALMSIALSAFSHAQYDESRRRAEDALLLARELGERNFEAMAMIRLVGANTALREHATAHAHLDALMPLATTLGGEILTNAHHYRAELLRSEGRLDEAEPLYLQVLAWRRGEGKQVHVRLNEAFLNLVLVGLMRRDTAGATQWMREAMAEAARDGRGAFGPAIYLDTLAAVMACHEAWVPSARMVGASHAYQQKTGFRTEPVDALAIDPMLAQTQAALGDEAYAAAVLDGQRLATAQAVAEGLAWLKTA